MIPTQLLLVSPYIDLPTYLPLTHNRVVSPHCLEYILHTPSFFNFEVSYASGPWVVQHLRRELFSDHYLGLDH